MPRRSKRLTNKKRKRDDIVDIQSQIQESSEPKPEGEMFVIENDSTLNNEHTVTDWSEWNAATSTKNYIMDDPFLDFLNYSSSALVKSYPNLSGELTKTLKEPNSNSFMVNVMHQGNEFESKVYQLLKREVGEENVIDIAANLNARSDQKYEATLNAMRKGVPFIYQGVVRNYKNKTHGIPDLIIRSDYINRILDVNALSKEEVKIPAPLCQDSKTEKRTRKRRKKRREYHYIVVDIKYRQLILRSDGIHLRNDNYNKAFKSQIWIYTDALGEMQGYTPEYGFILGSRWKYTSGGVEYSGNSCFEKLGRIDYKKLDKDYITKTAKAVEWLQVVKKNGKNWDLTQTPLPRPELYPNMCNSHDFPYHQLKEKFAESIDEISLLWYVGPKERRIAHSKGIYGWKDMRCTPETLEMKGEARPPVLRSILDTNRNPGHNIQPKYFSVNNGDWKNKKKVELFVDFEMNNPVFQNFESLPYFLNKTHIFLIGAGYICPDSKKWIYKKFLVNRITAAEESRICNDFMTFVEVLKRKYGVDNIPLFHYSHAEPSSWNRAGERYQDDCVLFYSDLEWVDMMKIFILNRVGIKGVLKYGLKGLVKIFVEHGYIKTRYDTGSACSNGADAAVDAYKIDRACEERGITFPDHPLTNEVVLYNEIDCRVLQEILEHIRENHIDPEDFDLLGNEVIVESFSEDSADDEYERIFSRNKQGREEISDFSSDTSSSEFSDIILYESSEEF